MIEPPEGYEMFGALEFSPEEEGPLLLVSDLGITPLQTMLLDPEHSEFAAMVMLAEVVKWAITQRELDYFAPELVNMFGAAGSEMLGILIAAVEAQPGGAE